MISNEEIQAMEILKSCGIKCEGIDVYKILLNLIHRYSNEIELLKEENEKYKNPPFFDEDKYTENDKIKAKIEEVSNGTYDAKIVLESLLEKEQIYGKLL